MNEANKKLNGIDESLIRKIQDDLNRLKNDYHEYKDDNDVNIKNIFE